jgi:hypothetical protein
MIVIIKDGNAACGDADAYAIKKKEVDCLPLFMAMIN